MKQRSEINILIACEESQRVCMAFRERGFTAYSTDIQEPSGGHPEWHILGDVLPILQGGQFVTMDGVTHEVGKWDLMIAHPPCTYLTNAGARHLWSGGKLNLERYEKGMKAKDFFMRFYNANIAHICIENPIPSKVFEMPKYSQIIQPYYFGHPITKKTCLWLKNIPALQPTDIVDRPVYREFVQRNGKKRRTCWEMEQKGGKNRAKERSKTFPGIAEAFAIQWGDYLEKEVE